MKTPTDHKRKNICKKPTYLPIVMYQKWRDLFFIHWEWDPLLIQAKLPPGLFVDTFEGKAYIGIVPFRISDLRARFIPSIAGLSKFLEINVRTYVYDAQGNPGVWFYSLDINSRLATLFARALYHLPYYYSHLKDHQVGPEITYSVHRSSIHGSFQLKYSNTFQQSRFNSLDFFLIERYLLFSYEKNNLYSARVFHHPYLTSPAKLISLQQNLLTPLPSSPPCHLAYSPGVDVSIYPIRKIL